MPRQQGTLSPQRGKDEPGFTTHGDSEIGTIEFAVNILPGGEECDDRGDGNHKSLATRRGVVSPAGS